MQMAWQPESVDATHEEDEGIAAPRDMRLVARYYLENATRRAGILSTLQRAHGTLQKKNLRPTEGKCQKGTSSWERLSW